MVSCFTVLPSNVTRTILDRYIFSSNNFLFQIFGKHSDTFLINAYCFVQTYFTWNVIPGICRRLEAELVTLGRNSTRGQSCVLERVDKRTS